MKTYNVKVVGRVAGAQEISAALDAAGVQFETVGNLCWSEYLPEVKFRMAHCGDTLFLHFAVDEKCVRSTCQNDNEAVWNDSCVEFFFSPEPGADTYYNMECNCTGALLLGYGRPKRCGGRQRAGADVTAKIDRWASLGCEAFGERKNPTHWEVALLVPAEVFFAHQISAFGGWEAAANFYKCGDALPEPHFVAWNRVETEKPDFHRPEFFGKLLFE